MKATLLCLALFTLTASAELVIPAMSAYSLPDAGALRTKEADGSARWKGEQTVLWYGQMNATGELTVAVECSLPTGKAAEFQCKVGDKVQSATAKGTGSAETISFGKYTISKTGYVSFALKLVGGAAAEDVKVLALKLDGPATAGAHFNVKERRNAASVHLNYQVKNPGEVTLFYNEVTAVEEPVHTFYMACGFSRGYFGMQVNSLTERRIIFSVWDSGTGSDAKTRAEVPEENQTQLVAKGEGVHASVFGNEGTGGHSHLKYLWKTGEPQKFTLTAKPDGTHTTYTGFWFHPEQKQWMLIASFRAPHDGKYLRGFHSFSENFVGGNGHFVRKARFGPAWIQDAKGQWTEILEANFSHDGTGKADRLDRFMGVEQGKFFLSHGGFVEGFTKYGTPFTRPATNTPPQLVLPK
jgi:hypothetical protein